MPLPRARLPTGFVRAGSARLVGQDHLFGPDGPVIRMVQAKRLASLILWGPPGTGKTTLARLLAEATGMRFAALSAVFSTVADLRKTFAEAAALRAAGWQTLLSSMKFTASAVPSRTVSYHMSKTAP